MGRARSSATFRSAATTSSKRTTKRRWPYTGRCSTSTPAASTCSCASRRSTASWDGSRKRSRCTSAWRGSSSRRARRSTRSIPIRWWRMPTPQRCRVACGSRSCTRVSAGCPKPWTRFASPGSNSWRRGGPGTTCASRSACSTTTPATSRPFASSPRSTSSSVTHVAP